MKADKFYAIVGLRGDIVRLGDQLLAYRLYGHPEDAEAFRKGTLDFKDLLEQNTTNATTVAERDFYSKLSQAYDDYLGNSAQVLQARRSKHESAQNEDFKNAYEKVESQSAHLLALCDEFIHSQRSYFDSLLKRSDGTLAGFKELLQISGALLFVLAVALLLLTYRGMIAPLQHRLTESQAIIARQEKLASLGVLAAGVAHEIRNPLTAIKFRLFSLKKSLTDGAVEDADVIAEEIARLERIVKDFLQFARPSDPQLVPVPAIRIVREVHDLLRPQLEKSAIELKLESSNSLWVRADTQQLKQVLINLVQNSADSIEHGGVIRLSVQSQPPARRQSPPTVVLEVADTGKGIPPEVQKRLFDPFFTTKAGGTGLGLPIAAGIVEKHGGQLRYHTASERGTTFHILLPAAENPET